MSAQRTFYSLRPVKTPNDEKVYDRGDRQNCRSVEPGSRRQRLSRQMSRPCPCFEVGQIFLGVNVLYRRPFFEMLRRVLLLDDIRLSRAARAGAPSSRSPAA